MKKVFLIVSMLLIGTASAGLSIKNEKDRSIFEDAVVLSSQILAKNSRDKAGNALLKFAAWMEEWCGVEGSVI